jgi:hypothetical protein
LRASRYLAPVLLLLVGIDTVPAGEPEILDSGTFTLFRHGARIGEERFVIRAEQAGGAGRLYRAGADLYLKIDGKTMRVAVGLEVLGDECHLRGYEAEINDDGATSIVLTLARDRIRLNVRSPRGDEMTEFLHRDRTVILDTVLGTHIVHQYFFAWKLLRGNRSSDATVMIPIQKQQHTARIEDRGSDTVRLNDVDAELRHVVVATGNGSTHHIWLDGEKVMKVEIPEDGFVALRSKANNQGRSQSKGDS